MAAETILKSDEKPEAVAILQILEKMNVGEQQDLLMFMQGAMYAKGIYTAHEQRLSKEE